MNTLNMVQIGKAGESYNPAAAINIPQHKLQVWPGYITTVEEYDGGLLLMCDVSHKVLRQQTAYGIMYVLTYLYGIMYVLIYICCSDCF